MVKRDNFYINYHPDNTDIETSRKLTKIRERYNLVALIRDKDKTTLLTTMEDPIPVNKLEEELSKIGIKIIETN